MAFLCRLLVQQPVVEATCVQFADAAVQFAQMALLDLGESLSFPGCWPDADSLLIEQVHLLWRESVRARIGPSNDPSEKKDGQGNQKQQQSLHYTAVASSSLSSPPRQWHMMSFG